MTWFHRVPLRLKIAGVGGVTLLLMLVAIALSSVSMSQFVASDAEKDRLLQVSVKSEKLLSSLIDMETGVRGYVITGDREFLEPYQTGAATYPLILQELERLLASDGHQLDRITLVKRLSAQWQEQVLDEEIRLVEQQGDAAAVVASKAGKGLMDQIRSHMEQVAARQMAATAAVTLQAQRDAQLVRTGTWALAAAAAMIGLFLAFALARSITRPVEELVAATASLGKGNYGHLVPIRAGDEVGRLAEAFNTVSVELLAHAEENTAQTEELQAQQEELSAQNETLLSQQETVNAAMLQLEEERDRLEQVNQFIRYAAECRDLPSLSQFILTNLLRAGAAQVGALGLLQPDGTMLIQAHRGLTEAATLATSMAGFPAQAVELGKPLPVSYPATALLRPVYHTQLPVEHEVYVPIGLGPENMAVAILGRTSPTAFGREDLAWLELLATQSATALSNRLAFQQLHEAFEDLQDNHAHIEELSAQVEEERDRAGAQRDNMRAILECTSEGIGMVDAKGRLILVNDRFWALWGLAPSPNLTVREICGLAGPQVKGECNALDLVDTVMADPDTTGTARLELAGAEPRVLQCYTAPVQDRAGRWLGRLFVLRDITRESEVDRMKTEFISTVSHELRTPLTAIRGYVELMLDGDVGEVTGEQQELLELVQHSTVRLSNLINDLLDVEKIEQGRMSMQQEPVDVGPLLDQVVRTFRITADEKGLDLNLQITSPLRPVAADQDRLMQVFSNLVSNAIKYTKEGFVTVSAHVEGPHLVVTVSDTGIGIASDHIPNLFGKFYRVDNQYTREVGGTGLGLAITQAIVERHGGRITVTSEPGKGSSFTVTLLTIAALLSQ